MNLLIIICKTLRNEDFVRTVVNTVVNTFVNTVTYGTNRAQFLSIIFIRFLKQFGSSIPFN